MSTWINNDGLEVKFGTTTATPSAVGQVSTDGDYQELVVKISGTDVPSTDAPVGKYAGIPSGAFLVSAELYVTTAFVGATATLDIGLMNDDGDGTYSTNDDDGVDAAIAVGSLTAGAVITSNGALIGTQVTNGSTSRPLVVSTGYNTAAFTAGEADLVIRYRV